MTGISGLSWVGPGKPNLPLGLRGKAGVLIDHVASSLACNSTELAWENLLGSSTWMLPMVMVPSDHLLSTPSFCFSSLSFGKTAPSPF